MGDKDDQGKVRKMGDKDDQGKVRKMTRER